MRAPRSGLLLVLVAAACSSGGPHERADAGPEAGAAAPELGDGTRLKALAYVMDDGQKLLHGWRDTARGETCTFMRASDGELRCLPRFETTTFFADDECTAPIVGDDPADCDQPDYVVAVHPGQCGAVGPLRKRGAAIVATVPAFWFDETGTCVSANLELGGGGAGLWAVDEAEPDTAFVRAQERLEDRGPALAARFFDADDGAFQLAGAYDRAAGRPCAESPLMPGACAPDPLVNVGALGVGQRLYTDAACSTEAAFVRDDCAASDPAPEIVLASATVQANACAPQPTGHFLRLGARVTQTFVGNPVGCTQTSSNDNATPYGTPYEVKGEIFPWDLPAVRTWDEGAGHFRLRTLETLDGQVLARTAIFDADQGNTCTPMKVDGILRCVADDDSGATGYYLDAACTVPAYSGTVCGSRKFIRQGAPSCRPEVPAPRYFEVGSMATTEKAFFGGAGSACNAIMGLEATVRPLTEHPLRDAPMLGGE